MKKIALCLAMVLVLAAFCGCGGSKAERFMTEEEILKIENNPTGEICFEIYGVKYVFAFELFYENAPIAVTNFIKLVNDNFYDGLIVHEKVRGASDDVATYFMGGYTMDSEKLTRKELNYAIMGEFYNNGYRNHELMKYGTMFMQTEGGYNTANSLFGILADEDAASRYQGKRAIIGRISNPRDLIKLGSVGTTTRGDYANIPNTIKISYIKITNTFGVDFGDPLTIKK